MEIEFSEHVDEPRPRTVHHTAVIRIDDLPLTVGRLYDVVNLLAPRVPARATIQVSYPHVIAYWQTPDKDV